MAKVALMRRRREGNEIERSVPRELYELSRVPCVGELVVSVDERGYRVVKVVHLLQPGDDGIRAEIYAEEIGGDERPNGWD